MCKLIVGIKKENSEDFEMAIKLQENELKNERDGIGALVVRNDGTHEVRRALETWQYDDVFGWVYSEIKNAVIVAVHTRTGTSGLRSLDNVHFFGDKLLMAHNGWVSKYHGTTRTLFDEGRDIVMKSWGGDEHDLILSYSSHKKPQFGFAAEVSEKPAVVDAALKAEWEKEKKNKKELDEIEEEMEDCDGCITANKGWCKRHKYIAARREDILREFGFDERGGNISREPPQLLCDSLRFLQNLPAAITEKSLMREMTSKDFSGMALLYDVEKKLPFIMLRNKSMVLLTNKKDFALFYSFQPNRIYAQREKINLFGIEFEAEGEQKVLEVFENTLRSDGVMKLEMPKK